MISYYKPETDYLEFFFKRDINYADFLDEDVTVFRSEKTDEIVGYGIEDASNNLCHFDKVDMIDKFGLLIKIARLLNGFTQEEVANKLGISVRHYQRLESGQDTTISLFDSISQLYPDMSFGSLFDHKKAG